MRVIVFDLIAVIVDMGLADCNLPGLHLHDGATLLRVEIRKMQALLSCGGINFAH